MFSEIRLWYFHSADWIRLSIYFQQQSECYLLFRGGGRQGAAVHSRPPGCPGCLACVALLTARTLAKAYQQRRTSLRFSLPDMDGELTNVCNLKTRVWIDFSFSQQLPVRAFHLRRLKHNIIGCSLLFFFLGCRDTSAYPDNYYGLWLVVPSHPCPPYGWPF